MTLTQGRVAALDEADLGLVPDHTWHAQRSNQVWYAATNVPHPHRSGYTMLPMHRLIMGLKYGDPRKVDHIDGDGLNNRRSNLRLAGAQSNRWNSTAVRGARSHYKGVNWCWFRNKTGGKWRAQISVDGRQRHLGLFGTEEEAAAYNKVARELHGEFARLNDVAS